MTLPVQVGSVLAGKFRIERVLAQGGMGVVVVARHLALGEDVALKFLLPEALANRELQARFEREARTAFRIRSEHVARVIDVGVLEAGEPYIVMEYLQGQDLAQILRTEGPFDLKRAADYLLQAGEALSEAHALGIVHRDLKPSNLFLTQRVDGSDCIKVIDFGISKATQGADGEALGMTQSLTVLGSPLYMSPEQLASSRDVDSRTDIWALGVTLFELLSGEHPFNAQSLPQLCHAVATTQPTPLSERRPELPRAVEDLVRRCLAKDPAERFQSVSELAVALAKFAPKRSRLSVQRITRVARARRPTSVAPEAPPRDSGPASAAGGAAESTFAEFGRTTRSHGRRGLRAAWLGGGALAVVGLVGWLRESPSVVAEVHPAQVSSQLLSGAPPSRELSSAGLVASALPPTPPVSSASAPPSENTGAPRSAQEALPVSPPASAAPVRTPKRPSAPRSGGKKSAPPSAKGDPMGGRL